MTDGWEQPDEATHHPVYIGTDPDEADCRRHGGMDHHRLVVKKDGHIHAGRDGVYFYACPECCRELIQLGGAPPPRIDQMPPPELGRAFATRMVAKQWEELSTLFVDLGPGQMEDRSILFEDDLDADAVPDYLKDSERWFAWETDSDTGGVP